MVTRLIAYLAAASFLASSISFASPSSGKQPVTISTIDDQQSVALTIYNVNLGLVKGPSRAEIVQGRLRAPVHGCGVPIIPTSVHIKSLSNPASLFGAGAELRIRPSEPGRNSSTNTSAKK